MVDKQGAALSTERLGVNEAGQAALADRAALLLARADARGATAAEVSLAKRQNLELTVRQGALETLEQTEGQDLSLTVFRGQRSATVSSSDLSPEACETLVDKALFLADQAEEDPHAGLAPPELAPPVLPNLDLFHPWALSLDEARALATACEAAALAVSPQLRNSEGATVASALGLSCYANSQGFLAIEPRSRHGLYAAVIAGEGPRMQRMAGASPVAAPTRGWILRPWGVAPGSAPSRGWMPAPCLRAAIPWCSIALWPARCWAISWGQLAAGPSIGGPLSSSMLWGRCSFLTVIALPRILSGPRGSRARASTMMLWPRRPRPSWPRDGWTAMPCPSMQDAALALPPRAMAVACTTSQ